MPRSVDVQVISNRQEAMREITDFVGNAFQQSFMETAQEVAKEQAPIDTGNLRDTIQWLLVSAMEIIFFTETGYGAYQELGTSKMPGKFFMLAGVMAGEQEFNRAFSK
jgi:hypothetical protein